MRFQYAIHYAPGKTLYTADMLFNAPIQDSSDSNASFTPEEIEQFLQAITAALPANPDHLNSYSKAQTKDSICSKLIEYCTSGWPKRNELHRELRDYCFEGNLPLVVHYCCTIPGL